MPEQTQAELDKWDQRKWEVYKETLFMLAAAEGKLSPATAENAITVADAVIARFRSPLVVAKPTLPRLAT
jgi:hypothetical protein